MNNLNNKIIVVLGPTSSGKSDVAIKLARKFDGEIISADSRQIYRGMDISSGKIKRDSGFHLPSVKGRTVRGVAKNKKLEPYYSEGIPHYMLDIISPKTNFSAAQFKRKAEKIIADILSRGKLPIICGGTGFWIKSIVDNITYPEVKPDWKLRENLSQKSVEELFTILKKLDPERAKNIDAKNKVRLIRAIEICKAIGKVPTVLSTSPACLPRRRAGGRGVRGEGVNYEFLQIGISWPKEKLHERIKIRLDQRFEEGMISEVERLHFKDKVSWKRLESFGLGYFWISQFLQNKLPEDQLFEKVYASEKDYAKRQMTWFKKDQRIVWTGNDKEIEKEAKKFIL